MQNKYPFVTYIYKDTTQKGHPRSMNILYDEVMKIKDASKNQYIFNLEDDWDFFIKDNYFLRNTKVKLHL